MAQEIEKNEAEKAAAKEMLLERKRRKKKKETKGNDDGRDDGGDQARVARGFEMDVEAERRSRGLQDLVESGNALAGAGVELSQGGPVQVGDRAAAVGGAIDGSVVEDYGAAVPAQVEVEFDTVGADYSCSVKGAHGVFGMVGVMAAVGKDLEWQ